MALVAKSYQNLEQVGEVFTAGGKKYIQVKTSNGSLKTVRVYSEKEYARYYGAPTTSILAGDHKDDPYYKPQKEVIGFKAGFITIFKGETFEYKEWFKEIGATYRKWWGWGLPGDIAVPEDLPDGVTAVRLDWSLVGKDDENLLPDEQVETIVQNLLNGADPSEYQGEVGDKLTLEVTVEKAIPFESQYGHGTCHIFRDAAQNCYVWLTTAKSWEEGTEHKISGTVKALQVKKGIKQTVLTRCKEVK